MSPILKLRSLPLAVLNMPPGGFAALHTFLTSLKPYATSIKDVSLRY
jgi:hypothetical protein